MRPNNYQQLNNLPRTVLVVALGTLSSQADEGQMVKFSLHEAADSEVSSSGQSISAISAISAKEAWAKPPGRFVTHLEFEFVENDPALSNVLIHGDSISIMYTGRVCE
ncbi:hypothetical protein [Aporhodopirellula aestuarii]|uniref:Galectin n=1 Tax=Aporhodopirellula aestuarii TaxID=2950107 RepID=A0ABT0UAB5_9BACT|nr:hypothetical protein [Aporhodopirellula aestuarii]MCM2373939.1 hypothetical protein [Aporhodopirellula aestuarii]